MRQQTTRRVTKCRNKPAVLGLVVAAWLVLALCLGGIAEATNDFSGSPVVSYWRFESGANFAVDGNSVAGNDFSEGGDVLEETSIYAEGACSAHGSTGDGGDKFYIADASLSSGFPTKSGSSGTFSVALWFRVATVFGSGATVYLVDKYNASNAISWAVTVYNNSGTYRVRIFEGYNSGASLDTWESTVVSLTIGQWYHVGYTYDASTQDSTLLIYDAGAGDTPNKTSGTAYADSHTWTNAMSLTTADLTVMCRSNASTGYLNGYVDELVICNTVLTGDDVNDIRLGTYGSNQPDPATNPSPFDTATGVSQTADLSWDADPNATGYDVYLDANDGSTLVSSNQPGTTYDPGTMDANETYYWRVDCRWSGSPVTGTVWSFTVTDSENSFGTDPNCVALWRFEPNLTSDGQGSNTLTNVTSHEATADTTLKKEGTTAAAFNGATPAYMTIADGSLASGFPLKSGDANKKISVCLWFRTDSLPSTGARKYLLSKWDEGNSKRSFAVAVINSGGTTYLNLLTGYGSGASEEAHANTGQAIANGTWYHAMVSYEDATKRYEIRVRDGTTTASVTGYGTNAITVSDAALYLGAYADLSGSFFNGRLDEVVVFSDILTAEEADAIATFTYTGPAGAGGGGGSIWHSVVE